MQKDGEYMHTPNYLDAFIETAEDCPVETSEIVPLENGEKIMSRKYLFPLFTILLLGTMACQFLMGNFPAAEEVEEEEKFTIPEQEEITPIIPTATPDLPRTVYLYADGNGDYPTIQAAIDALPANSTIMLGSGTFNVSDTLRVEKSLTIIGVAHDETDIYATGGNGAIYFIGPGEFNIQKISVLYQNSKQGHVVEFREAVFKMSECLIKGGVYSEEENKGGSGIWIENSTGTVQSSYFVENQAHGIQAREASQVTITKNIIYNNENTGIAVFDSSKVTVQNNEIIYNGIDGIYVAEFANAIIENNIINNNGEAGIVFVDQSGGVVKNNTCADNNKWGIYIKATANPILENNNCYGNTSQDILDNR
jgi:parallel beta-helix repeat protein